MIDFLHWWENDVNQPCLAARSPRCSGRVQQGHGWLEGGCGWFHSPALSPSPQGLEKMSGAVGMKGAVPAVGESPSRAEGMPWGRDGAWAAWLGKEGGRRMNGKSSSCSFNFIDLLIDNGMNLKWISGVSAKAAYFCHKWHVRQSENSAVQWDGEEDMLLLGSLCFAGARELTFILGQGSEEAQCFSKLENSQWNTLKIQRCPHFLTNNCSLSQGCASTSPSLGPRPCLRQPSSLLSIVNIYHFHCHFPWLWGVIFKYYKIMMLLFLFEKNFRLPFILKKSWTFLLKAGFFANILLCILEHAGPIVLDCISAGRSLKVLFKNCDS